MCKDLVSINIPDSVTAIGSISLDEVTLDPCQVTVNPPTGGWQSEEAYYLFISNRVKSLNGGQNLKEGVRMKFTVNSGVMK